MPKTKRLTVEAVLPMLREGPAQIIEAAADASSSELHAPLGAEVWSANEVLAHLRACADVWGGCVERILREDHPTIRAMNPRRWVQSTDYDQQDFRESLPMFLAQREELLTLLDRLQPEDWLRCATVTGAGEPLLRTVFDYAERLALHERPHVKQIRRTVELVSSRYNTPLHPTSSAGGAAPASGR